MFSTLPGVSAPPPFGGSARTVVVTRRSRATCRPTAVARRSHYRLVAGNTISPSGNIRSATNIPIVPVNSVVSDPNELGNIPIRTGARLSISEMSATSRRHRHHDRLRAGQRPAGRLHPGDQAGRCVDACVVNDDQNSLPEMQDDLPKDIKVDASSSISRLT